MAPYRAGRERLELGLTTIEMLLGVVVLALLSVIAIPRYLESRVERQRHALAAEARALHTAFLQYQSDHGTFPPESDPPAEALDLATLAPISTEGYLSDPEPLLAGQTAGRIAFYWAPDVDGPDSELIVVLRPEYDPDDLAYVLHTRLLDDGRWRDGVFFRNRNGSLVRAHEVW